MRSLRTWEGPCALRGDSSPVSFAPRTFTTGTLKRVEQEKVEMKAFRQQCRPIPTGTGGGSKLDRDAATDRRRAFARNETKLNRESPPSGGRSKVWRPHWRGPAALSCADFFSCARDFRHSSRVEEIKSRIFSMPGVVLPWRASLFIFCRPRGGGQKFSASLSGPAASQHASFPEFPKIFFSAPPRKFVAKFEVGGGVAHGHP